MKSLKNNKTLKKWLKRVGIVVGYVVALNIISKFKIGNNHILPK